VTCRRLGVPPVYSYMHTVCKRVADEMISMSGIFRDDKKS